MFEGPSARAVGRRTRRSDPTGFDLDSPLGRLGYDGMGAGWPDTLNRIGAAIDAAGIEAA